MGDISTYTRSHKAFLKLAKSDLDAARVSERRRCQTRNPDSLEQFLLCQALGDLQSIREQYEDGIKLIDVSSRLDTSQELMERISGHLLEGLQQHMFVMKYLHLASDKSVRVAVKFLKWLEQDKLSWRSNFAEVLDKVDYVLEPDTHGRFISRRVRKFDELLSRVDEKASKSESRPNLGGKSSSNTTPISHDRASGGGGHQQRFKQESHSDDDDEDADSIEFKLEDCTSMLGEDLVKVEHFGSTVDDLVNGGNSHHIMESFLSSKGKGQANSDRTARRTPNEYRPHKCDVCSEQFFSAVCLRVHRAKHSREPLGESETVSKPKQHESQGAQTDNCLSSRLEDPLRQAEEEAFDSTSHVKSVHGVQKDSMDRPTKPSIHSRSLYRIEKLHKCQICEQRFFSQTRLKKHVKTHSEPHEQPLKFDDCVKSFASQEQLERHKAQEHAAVGQILCDMCDFVCDSEGHLRSHKRQAHSDGIDMDVNCLGDDDNTTYKCENCDQRFRSHALLADHVSVHAVDHHHLQPYSCETCAMTFSSKDLMMAHQKDKHQMAYFACDYYDKNFPTTDSLRSHERSVHDLGQLFNVRPEEGHLAEKNPSTKSVHGYDSSFGRHGQTTTGYETGKYLDQEAGVMKDTTASTGNDPAMEGFMDSEDCDDMDQFVGLCMDTAEGSLHDSSISSSLPASKQAGDSRKADQDQGNPSHVEFDLDGNSHRDHNNAVGDDSVHSNASPAPQPPPTAGKKVRKTKPVNRQSFKCQVCARPFYSKFELNVHMNVHSRFACNVCGKLFVTENVAVTHFSFAHPGEETRDISVISLSDEARPVSIFSCSVCKEDYKDQSFLENHVCKPNKNPLIQKIAKKKPVVKEKTLRKRVICTYCGVPVPANNIRYHNNRHTGERPYKCKFCPKTFTSSINLSVHRDVHTTTTFLCPLCGKLFKTRASLRTHKKKIHRKKVAVKKEDEKDN